MFSIIENQEANVASVADCRVSIIALDVTKTVERKKSLRPRSLARLGDTQMNQD